MKILLANPADVAAADQAAAALPGTMVRLREFVPSGLLYVLREDRANRITDCVELEQLADSVIEVEPSGSPDPS